MLLLHVELLPLIVIVIQLLTTSRLIFVSKLFEVSESVQFEQETSSLKAPEPGNQASRSSFLLAA